MREGSDAQAEVVVKLVNEGSDAFRHETYGDTIGIRRRFGKKGGGKLDMLNENDEKVTSDRKELRSLLDSLKISVDNPVCVLDQENSKHFIRGKAKDKYKFFLRATEIEDVMNRITRCTSAADKCISDAEHQRGKLESFARLAQNAQREYEEVMRLAKYDEEIRDLKARVGVLRGWSFLRCWAASDRVEGPRGRVAAMASRRVHARRGRRAAVDAASAQVLLGWVSVRGCERAKENAEEGVREKRQELTDAQQLQKEHEDALETSGDDQVKALEDAISRGNDEIKECRDSTKEAMKALTTQEKQVKAAQRLEKQQRDLLAGPIPASRCTPSS